MRSIHECLCHIRDNGPPSVRFGICYAVSELTSEYECTTYIVPMFREWPFFSGDVNYPVPDPRCMPADMSSLEAMNAAHEKYKISRDLWTGAYGALRKDLLNFLIERTAP